MTAEMNSQASSLAHAALAVSDPLDCIPTAVAPHLQPMEEYDPRLQKADDDMISKLDKQRLKLDCHLDHDTRFNAEPEISCPELRNWDTEAIDASTREQRESNYEDHLQERPTLHKTIWALWKARGSDPEQAQKLTNLVEADHMINKGWSSHVPLHSWMASLSPPCHICKRSGFKPRDMLVSEYDLPVPTRVGDPRGEWASRDTPPTMKMWRDTCRPCYQSLHEKIFSTTEWNGMVNSNRKLMSVVGSRQAGEEAKRFENKWRDCYKTHFKEIDKKMTLEPNFNRPRT